MSSLDLKSHISVSMLTGPVDIFDRRALHQRNGTVSVGVLRSLAQHITSWVVLLMIWWDLMPGFFLSGWIKWISLVSWGLLAYTTASYVFLPWRSVFVTILDIGTHVSTLLLCLLLPFLITFEEEEKETVVYLGGESVCQGQFWYFFQAGIALGISPLEIVQFLMPSLTVLLLRAIFMTLTVCGCSSHFDSNWRLEMLFQRKFRSPTSDNMDSWKAESQRIQVSRKKINPPAESVERRSTRE